jgi:Holliday junction resolvase RusA-like endonuclease
MIEFFVPGKAQPGGSKKAFYKKKLNRVIVTDDNSKASGWKQDVKFFASKAFIGEPLLGPLSVVCCFHVARPQYHYGSGKNKGVLKDAYKDAYPTSKPDATKLFRSTEDALTGVIWKDDAQVVEQIITKRYSETPGAHISIAPM